MAQAVTAATQPKTKFRVEGDYFEACTCKVMCSCIFLAPATEDHCDVFIGWHVRNGKMGDADLKGLNAALVVSSPKQMTALRPSRSSKSTCPMSLYWTCGCLVWMASM